MVKNTARKNKLVRVINLSGISDGNMVGSTAENGKSGILKNETKERHSFDFIGPSTRRAS